MTTPIQAQNPRYQAVGFILVSPLLIGVNLLSMHFVERWYPILAPISGAVFFSGVVQLIMGKPLRSSWVGSGIALAVGMPLGFVVNRFLFGQWL